MFKNNAESSLFELLRDVFSKNFQTCMPFVWFLMFISFHEYCITGCIKFPVYDMRRLYVNIAQVKQFTTTFLAYKIYCFSLRDRL